MAYCSDHILKICPSLMIMSFIPLKYRLLAKKKVQTIQQEEFTANLRPCPNTFLPDLKLRSARADGIACFLKYTGVFTRMYPSIRTATDL